MPSKRLWLIDGHNIIFAVPSLQALQVTDRRDEARQALAGSLERFAHARGEKVRIVFDGNELASNSDAGRGALLEITYTRRGEETADDRIIHEARRRAAQRLPVTVVTNDISTLAGRLPRGVDHLGVGEFWLKHIEPRPAPGGKTIAGDFSDVESALLEYSAAEEASAARAAETTPGMAASGAPQQGPRSSIEEDRSARPSAEAARRDRIRLKREKGRLRHQRRLAQRRRPRR